MINEAERSVLLAVAGALQEQQGLDHHDEDEVEPLYLWRMIDSTGNVRGLVIGSDDNQARARLDEKFCRNDGQKLTWLVEDVTPVLKFPLLVCTVHHCEVRFPGTQVVKTT